MLDFHPGRIGHACFLDEEHWSTVKASKIPVEICLSSNIMTERIPSLDVHHFADLYNEKHPVVLCTDDPGVFSTSLSKEYSLAASTFGIGKKEMLLLAKDAVESIFSGEEVKRELRQIFDSALKEL
ncbi:hypothetical protein SAY87_008822 [Trapa incisa]|uniref:Adenosine deaminase domain-containing protein n=1 Tax=Trapa incisa TaxID=236973 RepID=A0AAN7JYU0_9MYRT|nr:hypothetical protein SAY87_008822 [Trapa incisa]